MLQQDCIASETLRELLAADAANLLIIDVRSPEEYAELYLPGAVNIPLDELPVAMQSFSPSQTVIAVCGKGGGRSANAAEMLRAEGFNAQYLCNGTFGWFSV
ncbi:MAG: rhodanese-like domain-containing protein [Taibaiella sp.]|nr:rhodanese-like domain-containing protein [Taibaiella sp.]